MESTRRIQNTFNDIHDIQIMAGSEIRKNWYNTQFTAGYGYDPKTLTTKPLNIRNDKDAEKYKLHTKTYQENALRPSILQVHIHS